MSRSSFFFVEFSFMFLMCLVLLQLICLMFVVEEEKEAY